MLRPSVASANTRKGVRMLRASMVADQRHDDERHEEQPIMPMRS